MPTAGQGWFRPRDVRLDGAPGGVLYGSGIVRGRAEALVLYGLIGVSGAGTGLDSPFTLLAMPIAVEEMVFAGWLIVKGLESRDDIDESSKNRRAADAPSVLTLSS